MDPYFIVPEKCRCIDYQLLKLQEAPEAVPNGELPRHVQLYCDRYLCDRVVPGNRVTVIGIYSIKKSFATTRVRCLVFENSDPLFAPCLSGQASRGKFVQYSQV